jgi:translation initiation factor 1
MKAKKATGGLVYSTEHPTCPTCRQPLVRCACKARKPAPAARDGIVRVGREVKGRAGKGVTVITGLPLPAEELAKLAGELKRKCGSGGTCKDGEIEIQGDHRDLLVAELARLGYKAKRSGG